MGPGIRVEPAPGEEINLERLKRTDPIVHYSEGTLPCEITNIKPITAKIGIYGADHQNIMTMIIYN